MDAEPDVMGPNPFPVANGSGGGGFPAPVGAELIGAPPKPVPKGGVCPTNGVVVPGAPGRPSNPDRAGKSGMVPGDPMAVAFVAGPEGSSPEPPAPGCVGPGPKDGRSVPPADRLRWASWASSSSIRAARRLNAQSTSPAL